MSIKKELQMNGSVSYRSELCKQLCYRGSGFYPQVKTQGHDLQLIFPYYMIFFLIKIALCSQGKKGDAF